MSGRGILPLLGAAVAGAVASVLAVLAMLAAGIVGDGDGDTPMIQTVTVPDPAAAEASSGGTTSADAVQRVYRESVPSVVQITARVRQSAQTPFGPQERSGEASGSGWVVDREGHIVTNAHVVEGATRVTVSFDDREQIPARITGVETSVDIAVLEVDPDARPADPLPIADSGEVEVGDPVVAIGNPFGLDRTATTGIVSALQREILAPNNFSITNVIQTDAAINPGNSGGPLLDLRGRVIGVNTQIASQSGGNEGIGFAVPSNTVERVARAIIQNGRADLPLLGVAGTDLDVELARDLGLADSQRGVLIREVTDDGPADRAGLRGQDVIVGVNGETVTSNVEMVDALLALSAGDDVVIVILRNGDRREVTVRLGRRPSPTP